MPAERLGKIEDIVLLCDATRSQFIQDAAPVRMVGNEDLTTMQPPSILKHIAMQ